MLPFRLDGPEATPLLPGITLLEASAGTGKTYTIAGLATRLVLEHDLRLERIAVMTFTIAATAELRDRIRTCLTEVARAIHGPGTVSGTFPAWVQDTYRTLPPPEQSAWSMRLRRALASVDAAPISTIHAFARRIAVDHAAHVGIDPAAAVTLELDTWRGDVVRDWFRVHLLRADPRVVGVLGSDPIKTLIQAAKSTEQYPLAVVATPPLRPDAIRERFDAAAAWWAAHEPRLIAHVNQHLMGIRKNAIHHPENIEDRLIHARPAFAGTEDPHEKLYHWWDPDKMAPALAVPAFDPAIFTDIRDHLPQRDAWAGGLCATFAADYREKLRTRCQTVHDLHVGDALLALHAVLHGDGGADLAAAIGSQFDAVLVDEFQDTDLMQWRILARCFGQQHRLMLIGDPKQAIYAFRGADVYAYTAARDGVAEERRFTLSCNFRSDTPLVDAIHALYLGHGSVPAVPDPFAVPDVNYHRVASSKAVRIDVGALDPKPLQILTLSPDLSTNMVTTSDAVARAVADEIARLLDPATAVRLTRDDQTTTPIVPGDIAVLVREHSQATLVHAQLALRGISAVRQDRSSVFASEAASEVQALLAGCLDPINEKQLHGAAGTRYIGASAHDLIADPPVAALTALPLQLAALGEVLERSGVAAWWYRCYDTDFGWGTPRQRLARVADGGRLIMDTLHLIELMAAETTVAPDALGDWLQQQRSLEPSGDDTARRLERDDAAVRILTVHVSKGLQYPIVFEAFAWQGAKKPRPPLLIHPGDGADAERHLGACAPASIGQAEREAMGDVLRKLYVGLTRAKHRLYVIWAAAPGSSQGTGSTTSPLAWVLCGRSSDGEPPTVLTGFADVQAKWKSGATIPDHPGIGVHAIGGASATSTPLHQAEPPVVEPRQVLTAQRFDRSWSRCSFTGLSHRAVTPDADTEDEVDHDQAMPHVPRTDDEAPGGAALGIVVHTLYEHADFTAWQADPQTVVRDLETQAHRDGVALTPVQISTLAAKMRRVIVQPIPQCGVRLVDLPATALAREWPVRLGLTRASASLTSIFAGRTPMAPDWPTALRQVSLPSGVFTGVLDVLFCHDGRYHVVDWKTNLLDAYGQDALWAAMADNHYLLQAHLYLLAAHRFLTWRLPDYEPSRHLGVAAYAFIRGMRDGDPAAGWAIVQPDQQILEALDACCS